jgi:phage tail-like protein
VADPQIPLVRAFNFRVKLLRSPVGEAGRLPARNPTALPTGAPLGDGGFQECSGLEVQMDVQEYLEGGRNDGVIRRAGRAKYQDVVLRRGMFFRPGSLAQADLWTWLQDVVRGVRPIARYDGIVEVLDPHRRTVTARWVFDRGLPVRLSGPQLNARTGEVAVEELHIAHEGLRLIGGRP